MRNQARCVSCGLVLEGRGTSTFSCPNCGNVTIGRCARCRDQGVAYSCPECEFRGP